VTRAAVIGVGVIVILVALAVSLTLAQGLVRDDGIDPRPRLARPVTEGDGQRPIRLVAVDPGPLLRPAAPARAQQGPAPVPGATPVVPGAPPQTAAAAPVGTVPLRSSR
jgi:hypothetical protein